MLKTKVSCWFCNTDTLVFVLNKNSWTCTGCQQYNGFTKDGDYNKTISEMQEAKESIKYCCTNSHSSNLKRKSNSVLCDKCNSNQEQKLKELNIYESNMNESNEKEYMIFKKRLDHVYDLCKNCKIKLAAHLKNIDQQIGNNVLRPRPVKNLDNKNIFAQSSNEILQNSEITNQKVLTCEKISYPRYNIGENFKSTIKKAYTIAGSVPNYVFSRNLINDHSDRKFERQVITKRVDDYSIKEDTSINEPPNSTINSSVCDNLFIVAEDVLLFLFMLLIFSCDLVNLINDSGFLQVEKNTNYEWFTTLLFLYNQVIFFIIFTNVLSIHLAYKRPKLSRFLMMFGFCFNLLVHFQLFDFKIEEQYITEVFVSFFLVVYLVIARIYNIITYFNYFVSRKNVIL